MLTNEMPDGEGCKCETLSSKIEEWSETAREGETFSKLKSVYYFETLMNAVCYARPRCNLSATEPNSQRRLWRQKMPSKIKDIFNKVDWLQSEHGQKLQTKCLSFNETNLPTNQNKTKGKYGILTCPPNVKTGEKNVHKTKWLLAPSFPGLLCSKGWSVTNKDSNATNSNATHWGPARRGWKSGRRQRACQHLLKPARSAPVQSPSPITAWKKRRDDESSTPLWRGG